MDVNGSTASAQQAQIPKAPGIPAASGGGEEQAEGGRVDNEGSEGGQQTKAISQPGVGGSVDVKA
ncbi:hypothetical protein MNBD_NITROSPINAE03-2065 [hydrothermal vent metagenome]|uniref:Uncharacterized protein n=1 Tax=hydrothermal vent metagenome TaxID=652676 RepID=A0A3B1C1F1_9ZZZZ